jgi:hypothetical protein
VRSETVALAVAAIAEITYVWLLVSLNITGFLLFSFGASVAAILFLGITFLPKYTVRQLRAEPRAALVYLANRLRLAGYRVEESHGKMIVRIGSFSAILVSARQTETGCRVQYTPYATRSGWGTLVVLLFIIYTAPAGFALALYGFLRATHFVKSRVAPLLPEDGVLPEIPAAELTRSLLLETVSEAYRTAAEAEEAVRSSYHDILAIVIFGAILAWFVLFIAFSFTNPGPDFMTRMGSAALFAALIAAGAAVPTAWGVRYRMWPNVQRHREWTGRLRSILTRAASPGAPEGSEPSAFEVLMEAAFEVPAWIHVARRGGINRDPVAGFALLMVIIWTFTLASAALSFALSDVRLAGLLAGVSVLLSFGGIFFYRRWRHRWDAETDQALRLWTARIESVRARMERYLRDL